MDCQRPVSFEEPVVIGSGEGAQSHCSWSAAGLGCAGFAIEKAHARGMLGFVVFLLCLRVICTALQLIRLQGGFVEAHGHCAVWLVLQPLGLLSPFDEAAAGGSMCLVCRHDRA